MRLKTWLTAFAVCTVAACSSDSNDGSGSYGKKSDPFGEALSKLYRAMPGGNDLLRQASRSTFDDAIAELVEYSASSQESRRPNAGQDIELIGSARRYMDEQDIALVRQRFPVGAGSLGWTTRGSMPLQAGDYAFFHMQTAGEIPVGDISKILQYAIVGDGDGDPANNWQGQGQFDLDFFNNTDLWLQLLKNANEEPRLTLSRINGTTITPVETAARAIACANALLFMIPFAELGGREFAMAMRGTAFDNIDGNFGFGNTAGWSGDDAPSRLDALFVPNAGTLGRIRPRVEIEARFIVINDAFYDQIGVDFRPLGDFEQGVDDSNIEFGSMGIRAGSTSRLGGVPGYLNFYEEGMPAGGLSSIARDTGTPLADIPMISSLFGDPGNPFTLSPFNASRFLVTNPQGPLGVAPGTYADPTRGSVIGDILAFDDMESLLALIESTAGIQGISQPRITTQQGQRATMMLRNVVDVPLTEFNQNVRDFATNNNVNATTGDTGVSLTITPRIVDGDRIELGLRPSISALLNMPNGATVNGQPVDVMVPFVETADIATTVLVDNGSSLVIGGLLRDGDETAERGVPFLGDIPVLGSFFRNERFHQNRTELLIIITPNIERPE